jgi:hypothetical protein
MTVNVAITQDTANPYSESDIRFNPADPSQVIAASNSNAANAQAQYYSSDGGSSWGQTALPLYSTDTFESDPAVDWTSDGSAWALTIGVLSTVSVTNFYVRCFKSTDGGQTWTYDSTPSGTHTGTDKPSLWVDHSPASPYQDNMYAIWHEGATAFVSVRQGPAGTWSAPLAVSGAETTFTADGGDIKTNANGDVFAFWPNGGAPSMMLAKSTDGGASFGAPITVAPTFGSFTVKVPAQDARAAFGGGTLGALIYASGGAYRTTTEDLVCACWADLSGGPGCTAEADEPVGNITSTCKTRVWFARSIDGGATWGAPVKINDQPSLNDQFFPRLAVDPGTGYLMVVYYDTVNDPERVRTDMWMQTSTDGGVSWRPAVQVTTASTEEAVGDEDNGQEFGDYIGLTVASGQYFACWTDRRAGAAEQIWGVPLPLSSIAAVLEDDGNFGTVCGSAYLTLKIFNVSPLSVTIDSVVALPPGGDFSVLPSPSTPVPLLPGDWIEFIIAFSPTATGVTETGTIQITTTDPFTPTVDLTVTGTGGVGSLSTVIADSGAFGKVCVGNFCDQPLTLCNSGDCPLTVTSITSSSSAFLVPSVVSYPLLIASGGSLIVPIRFQPTTIGPASATIEIDTAHPATTRTVAVSGSAPAGKLAVTGSTHFGEVDCGTADRTVCICNVGECPLEVTSVAFHRERRHFKLINNPFPATLHPGSCLGVVIQYEASCDPECCELVIKSDDPTDPVKILDVVAYTRCKPACECKPACSCGGHSGGCCGHG